MMNINTYLQLYQPDRCVYLGIKSMVPDTHSLQLNNNNGCLNPITEQLPAL